MKLQFSVVKNVFKKLSQQQRRMSVNIDGYGAHTFKGAVAAPFLAKHGLAENTLDTYSWTTNGSADKVAAAVLDWALANHASVYCHWFQPLGASGLRHGQTGQVQNSMLNFDKQGKPVWEFTGKQLLSGETDGSSYPNGGLRATHRAGGYVTIDPTSPIFLRGDTIFIPACLSSFYGHALDEKTPLHRASDALSREGVRLLDLLGVKTSSVQANIGLEQELFFVPKEHYHRRPDLQAAGRTVIGRLGARGQELGDHYMAPLSHATPALACMQEVQSECFKIGIPLVTRHREAAPGQFEFAPKYGSVTTQVDQNLVVMQIVEEVAARHGLAVLLQEKPFQGINGSGKHNNWSIATTEGLNLLNFSDVAESTGSNALFPIVMAAVLRAVSEHGDLMRLAIATPGNDFRLGACEAPPSIMSVYLGESMSNFLSDYSNGVDSNYERNVRQVSQGSSALPPVLIPSEDRNRTSPFPYGGHRFEFRAVGSTQNASIVNTVLATVTANTFREFSEAIEAGQKPRDVAEKALKGAWKTIFNGNGYDKSSQDALTAAGVWRIDSSVDAICRYTAPKNIALFEQMGVLTAEECAARQTVLLTQYAGVVEMEAETLVNMLRQHIIPAVKTAEVGPLEALQSSVHVIKAALAAMHHATDLKEKAELARVLRLETMQSVRAICDEAEAVVPADLWTLATYKELLFMDQHYTY